MSALREILAAFSISVEDDELHKASKHIEGFIGKLQAAVPILAEAFAVGAITEFISATVEAGAHVADLSNKLGVGATELQQFQFAAKLTGVEAETAAHSLGFLNRNVGEALTGNKEAAEAFQKLGVTIKDSSGHTKGMADILPEVADGLQKLPDQQTRAAYAIKLFGREGQALLPVLGQGSEKLKEVYAEFEKLGGGMSEDFVKDSKETQDNIDKLKFSLQSIRYAIVAEMVPAVNWLIDKAKDIIGPIREWIKQTNVLHTGLEFLAILMSGKLVLSTFKLLRVIGLLKGTVFGTLQAFAGFAWPLVAIGALYLIFDDLVTLLEGGDSQIGHFIESVAGVEGKDKFVDSLRQSWTNLLTLLAGDTSVEGVNDNLSRTATIVDGLTRVIYICVTAVKTLFDSLVGLAGVAKAVVGGLTVGDLINAGTSGGVSLAGKALVDAFSNGAVGKAIDKTGDQVVNDAGLLAYGFSPQNHPATAGALPETGAPLANNGAGNWVNLDGPSVPSAKGLAAAAPAPNVHNEVNVSVNVEGGKNAADTGRKVGQAAGSEVQKTLRDANAAMVSQ